LRQLLRQLADPRPAARKKAAPHGGATAGMIALRPPWNDWARVRARCLDLATVVTEGLTARPADAADKGVEINLVILLIDSF